MTKCSPVYVYLFVALLCLRTAEAQPKRGDPKGSTRFMGVFTVASDGDLIMKNLGQETRVTLKTDTPIIGMFRAGKPLIDKPKGVINYQLLMSPTGSKFVQYKLQKNCKQIEGYRRFSWITGFTSEGLEPHSVHLTVVGFPQADGSVLAHTVYFEPIGDPLPYEDPKLPRLLSIGDSISFNYFAGLRTALKGKMNVQHPRRNCGRVSINPCWLGAYDEPGRAWDVIAFNGGHWNSGSTRADYRRDFSKALEIVKLTGAKLIWITTCPIPYGYNIVGATTRSDKSKVPREQWVSIRHEFRGDLVKRVPGRMRLQNAWIADILKGHPDVAVCDQWQFVKDGESVRGGPYEIWWYSKNVHFNTGEQSTPLGQLLAEAAMVVAGKKKLENADPRYRRYIHVSTKSYEPAKAPTR